MEHFQEFVLEQLTFCLMGAHVRHFHFDVKLFLIEQNSLFVHLQPGIMVLFMKL